MLVTSARALRAGTTLPPHSSILRLLSTSTASVSTSTAQAPSTALNPPVSTLPPPLSVPAREPDQSTFSYLFSSGKAYLTFYKTGLRAVWTNHRAAAALRDSKLRPGGYSSVDDAATRGALTRGEWLLARRAAADSRRIPLFALLFAVCGELTPFAVLFAGALVPHTCRIPRQVAIERGRRAERKKASLLELRKAGEGGQGEELGPEQLRHVGRALDLYGKTWDRALGGMPGAMLRPRVERRLQYLALDDNLLREGGPAGLSEDEVRAACEERGLDVLNAAGAEVPAPALRESLAAWLEAAEGKPMVQLLLANEGPGMRGTHKQ